MPRRADAKQPKKHAVLAAAKEPESSSSGGLQLKPLLLAPLIALAVSFVAAGGPRLVQQKALLAADLRGWLGRPALGLDGTRALLVVGTMGSGTTQRAQELRDLGLEVGHEASDSREVRCRDATVSWAHGIRFIGAGFSAAQRSAVVGALCQRPRFKCWSTTMFDGSPSCRRAKGHYWDACWEAECRRVAAQELGCAAGAGDATCTTPFTTTLLQVRHPLRTVATLVKAFCEGLDTAEAARASIQLDTIEALLPAPAAPPPPPPAHREAGKGEPATAEGVGECSRRFGWYWVQYVRAVRPHAQATYRVENASACELLMRAGVLAGGGSGGTLLPAAVARAASERCAVPNVGAGVSERAHGHINARNVGGGRFVLDLQRVAHTDAPLAEAMAQLARELGYGELTSSDE